MVWEAIATVLFGILAIVWGARLGKILVRRGAKANDLFPGNPGIVIVVLLLYVGLVAVAVGLPQWQGFPLEWRFYGLRVTWTIIRVMLLGVCGVCGAVSWRTARVQLWAVAIVGVLGMFLFFGVESYFVGPIYGSLRNDLRPNGIYRQTSNSSCAAAALATLLHDWQVTGVTEATVAKYAQTSRMGTSTPQVIEAARHFGFDGVELLSMSWEKLLRINRPGILSIWVNPEQRKDAHAIVLMAMDREMAIVADPAQGQFYTMSAGELDRVWRKEFVPIFKAGEMALSRDGAIKRLVDAGYKKSLREFQREMGVKVTGDVDVTTAVFLSGRVIRGFPDLDRGAFDRRQMRRMGCEDRPGRCVW